MIHEANVTAPTYTASEYVHVLTACRSIEDAGFDGSDCAPSTRPVLLFRAAFLAILNLGIKCPVPTEEKATIQPSSKVGVTS